MGMAFGKPMVMLPQDIDSGVERDVETRTCMVNAPRHSCVELDLNRPLNLPPRCCSSEDSV